MADLTRTDLTEVSKNWAQERTLQELVEKTGVSNKLLKSVANGLGITDDKIKEFDRAVSSATSGLNTYRKAELDAVRDARNKKRIDDEIENSKREINRKYADSVNDLRRSIGNLSNYMKVEGIIELAQHRVSGFGGQLVEAGGILKLFGKGVMIAGVAIGTVVEGVKKFIEINKDYITTVNSGLSFGGKLEDFAETAFKSGLGLQNFTQLMVKHSESAAAIGNKEYAQNIRNFQELSKASNYFGMSLNQLAEGQASYIDMLTHTGLVYSLTEKQRNDGTKDYLNSLNALSVVQGKQRETIEAEQQQAVMKSNVRLKLLELSRTLGPDQAKLIAQNFRSEVGALGQDAAMIDFQRRYMGGALTRQQGKMLSITGNMPSLNLEETDPKQFAESLKNRAAAISNTSPAMLSSISLSATMGGGLADIADPFAEMVDRSMHLALISPDRQKEFFEIFSGVKPIVDGSSAKILDITANIAHIEGDLAAKMVELAAKTNEALGILTNLSKATTVASDSVNKMTSTDLGDPSKEMIGATAIGGLGAVMGYETLKSAGKLITGAGKSSISSMFKFGRAAVPAAEAAEAGGAALAAEGGLGAGLTGLAVPGAMLAGGAAVGGGTSWLMGKVGLKEKWEKFLGGATAGAGVGAGVGTLFGGIGAVPGAVIGGIGGGLGGLLFSNAGNGDTTETPPPASAEPVPSLRRHTRDAQDTNVKLDVIYSELDLILKAIQTMDYNNTLAIKRFAPT